MQLLPVVSHLWKVRDRRVIPALLKTARESPFEDYREKAIRSLGLLKAGIALNLFRRIVSSENYFSIREKAAAMFALGFFNEPVHRKILKKGLFHFHPFIRKEAVASLVRFFRQDASVLSFLDRRRILQMTSPSFELSDAVRAEALHALCYLKPLKAERLLQKTSRKDFSSLIRQKSFLLLKQFISEPVELLALKGMEDISWKVRFAACALLAEGVVQNKIWQKEEVERALDLAAETYPTLVTARRRAGEAFSILKGGENERE